MVYRFNPDSVVIMKNQVTVVGLSFYLVMFVNKLFLSLQKSCSEDLKIFKQKKQPRNMANGLFQMKLNHSLFLLYYAKVCNEFAGPISASVIAPGQHSSFRKNVAAVTSRWQH